MHKYLTEHHYYLGLLTGLFAVFVVAPFFDYGTVVNELLGLSLLVTMLFAVLVISHSKKLMTLAVIFAAPLVIASLQTFFGQIYEIGPLVSGLSGISFIMLIIIVMLRDMFLSEQVDFPLIVGAISLYFLLGLLWGFIYLVVDHIQPGSFRFDTVPGEDHMASLIYYSLVTLTTLGYGDITPLSPPARAMATMEAVVGQLYLTVLVARLVGMHIAQRR